jgi:hypothetical protein
MPSVCIAGPHRYPDLARLWLRSVLRDVVPAFERAGWRVEARIYCDSGRDAFPPEWFRGAVLEEPRPEARDFVEFYDAALSYDFDYIFFIDADLSFADSEIISDRLSWWDANDLAAISFLKRAALPGVYAILCRREAYAALGPRALAATYENLAQWPDSLNRGPGECAALRLASQDKRVVDITPEAQPSIADFHGTTVIRASREMFAEVIGEERFEHLIAGKRYFCMGAYDNLLLGSLYSRIFPEPFAAGTSGEHMGGSVTETALRRILRGIENQTLIASLSTYFKRSNEAILRLAGREGIDYQFPSVIPGSWGVA